MNFVLQAIAAIDNLVAATEKAYELTGLENLTRWRSLKIGWQVGVLM